MWPKDDDFAATVKAVGVVSGQRAASLTDGGVPGVSSFSLACSLVVLQFRATSCALREATKQFSMKYRFTNVNRDWQMTGTIRYGLLYFLVDHVSTVHVREPAPLLLFTLTPLPPCLTFPVPP